MRDAITGAWLYALVLVFMVIFVGFLALSLNYNRAFQTKNGLVRLIELNEGYNNRTRERIEGYLIAQGYRTFGRCPAGMRGRLPNANGNRFLYCISYPNVIDEGTGAGRIHRSYYDVIMFFRIDLPVIGEILVFPISGRTQTISRLVPN